MAVARSAYLPIARALGIPVRWWHPTWLIRRRTFAAIVEKRPDLIAMALSARPAPPG